MIDSPESPNIFLASFTFVPVKECLKYHVRVQQFMKLPSSLTTSGILSPKFLVAAIIPLAIVAQLTMPPKTLTRITFTLGSGKICQLTSICAKKKFHKRNFSFRVIKQKAPSLRILNASNT